MVRRTHSPKVESELTVTPIEKGGTAAFTLAQAAINLQLVKNTQKNMPGGVVALDAAGQFTPNVLVGAIVGNAVNVDGNFTTYATAQSTFTITDYDVFRNYNVTVNAGTVSRNGDTITYTAPSTPQNVTMTINDRQFTVVVLSGQPKQPVILVPTNGATGTNTSLTFQADAFQAIGTPDTHASSDWQVATDAAFTTVVQSSMASTTNKTTWTPAAFNNLTTYYVRVRYRGASGNVSAWSDTSTFTTQNLAPPVLTLNASVSGQAQAGFFQQIGTYTGTITSLTVLTGPTAVTYSNGAIYYNGDMPYAYNGAALQIRISNSAGSDTKSTTVSLTPGANLPALQTQNFSFPVNQQIATFTGGRKWIAAPTADYASVNSGTLPPGVQLSSNQGGNGDIIVGGTPTATGTYNFTLQVYRYNPYGSDTGYYITPTITLTITP